MNPGDWALLAFGMSGGAVCLFMTVVNYLDYRNEKGRR